VDRNRPGGVPTRPGGLRSTAGPAVPTDTLTAEAGLA
jgi:hypothetical protein